MWLDANIPGGGKPAHKAVEDTGPPESFVDNTVRVFKLNQDGTKGEHIKDVDPFPEGWDKATGFNKVDIVEKKEEDKIMPKQREDKSELMIKAKELMQNGATQAAAAKELGLPYGTLDTWLRNEKKSVDPQPEPQRKAATINKEFEDALPKPNRAEAELQNNATEDAIKDNFTAADENPIDYLPTGKPYIMEHHLVAEEIACLLDNKRHDYGTENIKKFGAKGCLVRVSDKVERLINLVWNGDCQPHFESLEDTWEDIAGYAVLALMELRAGR